MEGIYDGPMAEDFKAGAGDERLVVIFRQDILKDEERTISEGRPIYRDVDWIEIYIPGDKTTVINQPATDFDRKRFPVAFARYKQGLKEEEQIVGTPLKQWTFISRSQA